MANYIYTSCTDPSISGVSDQNFAVITGYYGTGQLTGCLSNTNQTTTGATDMTYEADYVDCADCQSGYTTYAFINCCTTLTENWLIPHSGATAFTFGQVYVNNSNGVCYTLNGIYTGGAIVGIFDNGGQFADCVTCTAVNPCLTPTPTPTPTITPTNTPSPL